MSHVEEWTDITLRDALSLLATRVEADGLEALIRLCLDKDGYLLYVPLKRIEIKVTLPDAVVASEVCPV